MGALLAFDLAHRLRQQGDPRLLHLFVAARRAPQLAEAHPPTQQLLPAAFVEQLSRCYNAIPRAVLAEAELMELFLPTRRRDVAIHETYVYDKDALLAYPISAFGGLQDRRVKREHLEAWREQTQSRFILRLFPRDHFFLQSARALRLRTLSEDLTDLLEQLPEAGGA
jgi:medium-chain acyl-[acyl-carrier-protein] hydrolase